MSMKWWRKRSGSVSQKSSRRSVWGQRPASSKSAVKSYLTLETLEDRLVPTTVNWINASGGNYDAPANWSTGQVPGPGDDAVIDTAATLSVVIQAGDNKAVHSLTTTSNDTLTIAAGGSLTVAANSTFAGALAITGGALELEANSTLSGPLTLAGGSLTANGAGITVSASGTTTDSGGSLFAEGGATLSLPGLTSFLSGSAFTTTVEATGAGSVLTLANLTSLTVPTAFPSQAPFEALGGGTLTLPALTSINTCTVNLESDARRQHAEQCRALRVSPKTAALLSRRCNNPMAALSTTAV